MPIAATAQEKTKHKYVHWKNANQDILYMLELSLLKKQMLFENRFYWWSLIDKNYFCAWCPSFKICFYGWSPLKKPGVLGWVRFFTGIALSNYTIILPIQRCLQTWIVWYINMIVQWCMTVFAYIHTYGQKKFIPPLNRSLTSSNIHKTISGNLGYNFKNSALILFILNGIDFRED